MKHSILYYSVGALLYCPANNEHIAHSIITQKLGTDYSLALCLEDTIGDNHVAQAEAKLIDSIHQINENLESGFFYLPKIFIRVRCPEQITRLLESLGNDASLVKGFIIPKFSLENADNYIHTLTTANQKAKQPFYMMPIMESPTLLDLRNRYDILYSLKEKLDSIEEWVLNIRVGGNDLCHLFGFRRHADETIHDIKPVSNLFSDIITVYGMDYVVSGPVWEYYNGDHWKTGLTTELKKDKLCGFVGKTVIHPKQIDLVNAAYKVSKEDFDNAKAILSWNTDSPSLVSGNARKERMDEFKTHSNWAQEILIRSEAFGIHDE